MPERAAQSSNTQLLLDCARGGTLETNRIRSLSQNVQDWDALAEAAVYHGLAALLYRTVDAACPDLMPEHVAKWLRADAQDSVRRNLILTSQLLSLQGAFKGEGIDAVPLKGPVLAELLYPDPVLRPFSDLDFLVRKRDVPAAVAVLTRNGYVVGAHLARFPLRTQMTLDFQLLFHHERLAPVDIQWETAPSDFPFRFDTEILWKSLNQIRIAGTEIPSLSLEGLLLFLCVHGTKHMWSRLQWLGDIARLSHSPVDWVAAQELAGEAQCERPLLLGLLLAHDLLGALVPGDILQRARATQAVQSRASEVISRLMRMQPVEPEGAEFTRFNARMAERTWGKLRHYAALLKAPTDKELRVLQLPRRLFFLYYPLRAARLALQYGKRLIHKQVTSSRLRP